MKMEWVNATKWVEMVETNHLNALSELVGGLCIICTIFIMLRQGLASCLKLKSKRSVCDAQPTLIIVTGFLNSGKNAVADVLVENFNFRQIAFADALRRVGFRMLTDIYGIRRPNENWFHDRTQKETSLQVLADNEDIVGTIRDSRGSERTLTPRELLRSVGMIMRDEVDENVWRDSVLPQMREVVAQNQDVVVTDGRFLNECSPRALKRFRQQCGFGRVELWLVHDPNGDLPLQPRGEQLEELPPSERYVPELMKHATHIICNDKNLGLDALRQGVTSIMLGSED